MPNTSLYIKEDDVELFDQAKDLAEQNKESLSEVIASALEDYVEKKESEGEGFSEITIKEGGYSGIQGDTPDIKEVKFFGRRLAGYRSLAGDDTRGVNYNLYQSKKGKFLLHIKDWSKWRGEPTSYRYEIFDSLDEVEGPDRLIRDAKEELGEESAVYLDI